MPVKGAGYRGRFGGEGWDGMWTDMSEIVRPTRDGIHGREYISTAVDIGEKPLYLEFYNGASTGKIPRILQIPIPIVFDVPPRAARTPLFYEIVARAARRLETLCVVPLEDLLRQPPGRRGPEVVPLISCSSLDGKRLPKFEEGIRMVELLGFEEGLYRTVRERFPEAIVAVRLPFGDGPGLLELYERGLRVFHLTADYHGRGRDGRFVQDLIREAHDLLVAEGVREEVTLLGSGGIAAVGLLPDQLGVSPQMLEHDYLVTIAYLDPTVRPRLERECIAPVFEVDHERSFPTRHDPYDLGVKPPEVRSYFVRVRPDVVEAFAKEHGLKDVPRQALEDEIVHQNSYRLNETFYASEGEKRAFVLSHGKNLLVLKMVGYGDDVIRHYRLEDLAAHVWIGHHRYPTKGKVWHPGGAHPFLGMHEALVHNGDFANYASIVTYLAQRNIRPLFLTDTEVAALVFDLHHRVYGYPLEYVIESLAPTTERDFALLPPEKQRIYQRIQVTHIHGSPDGPWFFLIAQSTRDGQALRCAFEQIPEADIPQRRCLLPGVFPTRVGGRKWRPSCHARLGFEALENRPAGQRTLPELKPKREPRLWEWVGPRPGPPGFFAGGPALPSLFLCPLGWRPPSPGTPFGRPPGRRETRLRVDRRGGVK